MISLKFAYVEIFADIDISESKIKIEFFKSFCFETVLKNFTAIHFQEHALIEEICRYFSQ